MVTREQLLAELNARVEAGKLRNVDIARALDLPDSRIPGLLRGERRIYLDEATRLVEKFGLEPSPKDRVPPLGLLLLAVQHIGRKFGTEPTDAQMTAAAADLRAYLQYAATRSATDLERLSEGFFDALSLHPSNPEEADPQGTDSERTR